MCVTGDFTMQNVLMQIGIQVKKGEEEREGKGEEKGKEGLFSNIFFFFG